MLQRRFWGARRDWTKTRRRARKNEFNAKKGIWEAPELEEQVVKKIVELLWYSGVPVFRERERVPMCGQCGAFVAKPSDAGHPDLHGWVPAHKSAPDNRRALGAIPFYIEAKRPKGGVASEVQKEFIRRARRDGVLAFFATCWEDVVWNFHAIGVALPEG